MDRTRHKSDGTTVQGEVLSSVRQCMWICGKNCVGRCILITAVAFCAGKSWISRRASLGDGGIGSVGKEKKRDE